MHVIAGHEVHAGKKFPPQNVLTRQEGWWYFHMRGAHFTYVKHIAENLNHQQKKSQAGFFLTQKAGLKPENKSKSQVGIKTETRS